MADWYYEENGAQRGPVSEADLRVMLGNGLLARDTRVWTASFGSQWLPASQTELRAHAQAAPAGGPPPLTGAAPLQPAFAYPVPPIAGAGGMPMTTSAWLIIGLPILMLVAEIMLAFAGRNPNVPPQTTAIGFWGGVLLLVFAWKDAQAIQRAGFNPTKRTMVPFMLLTPIGYFIRRKVVTGSSLAPLWMWLACGLGYGILSLALFPE